MPRKPRMYLPGVPCHVIQRGNNRDACFYAEPDYRFYLDCCAEAGEKYGVAIHAYVLMTNHVHMLLTPAKKDSISLFMQSLGRRYVQYMNRQYRRTGTLWESRHKASLVDADEYLLTCYKYIELNPVRAGMVQHPGEYKWSSHMGNAFGEANDLITPHENYLALGRDNDARHAAYRELFCYDLDIEDIHKISNAASLSMPVGDSRFIAQIEHAMGRSIGRYRPGRPSKNNALQ